MNTVNLTPLNMKVDNWEQTEMTKETKNDYQRWLDLTIKLVEHKGKIATMGFLAGILARRTGVDWDLKRMLDQLEERYCEKRSG